METETEKPTPILKIAWTRFAQLDASSKRGTSLYRTIRRWIIILGVLATLFAILSQLFPRAGSGVQAPAYINAFCTAVAVCNAFGFIIRVLLVTIPILASVLAVIATRGFSNGDWLITRAGAEEIQKEIYFYRTILQNKKSRRDYLEKRLSEIQRRVNQGMKREFVYKSYKRPTPPNYSAGDPDSDPGFDDLTGEEYFRYRLAYQLAWHNKKLNQYKAERFRLQLWIVIFGAAGALLAAFNSATIWVALTASLTAAFVGWQELRNLDAIIKNYSKVVMELTILHDHWLNLEAEERTDEEFYKMVRGCEDILWAQNAEYIKSMQETLKAYDLEAEASLVNRVIKEATESAARMKQEMRDSVVELTHDTLLKAEETVTEEFRAALGSLAEEASSDLVQKELEAMRQAVVELAENVMEKTTEQVAFTAYHSKEGRVLVWHPLLVYIHTLSAFDIVQKDARLGQIKVPKKITNTSTTQLSRGTEITVIPSCEGITFNPESSKIKWIEDYQRVEFHFSAEESLLDDAAKGYINFLVGPLIVGSLKFSMLFNNSEDQATPDHKVHSEMYKRDAIFISYSHKDTEITEAFKMVHRATSHDVLRDIDDLRAGQDWNPRLMQMIDRADIFQLFWSKNSSQSEYCQQEWQYALKRQKEGFIRPIYWNKPMPNPPDELSKYHFEFVKMSKKKRSARK